MYSKKLDNPESFFSTIKNNSSIMSGGFGLCGIPENSIDYLAKFSPKNLTIISNNIGNSGRGLVKLLKKNMISKAICSYVGGNPDLEERIINGDIEVILTPQGSFIEKIRSAGAGIPAFYTPTGGDTEIENGKETRIFNGKKCLLEEALYADYSIIKATVGDEFGNLYFEGTSKNFSPLMAMAAKTTIVEVEKLVPIGELEPDLVQLPGIFVKHIYLGKDYRNDIEFLIEKKGF
jgi:3-oxoacid CoA-transferase subunit A